MKVVRAVLLGVMCVVTPDTSGAMSPAELLRSCAEIVNMAPPREGGEVNIPSNGSICWYYMSAIQNMSVLEDVHGVRLLGICAPPDTHLMDFVRIFVQKAQKRMKQYKNAAAIAVVVLSQSFPCDTNGPSK
jgi:Rap1a immunity proteins